MNECPQCGSEACMSCEAGAELARRNTQLVEALTNSDSLLRTLTGPDDLVAEAALTANREALATVSKEPK